MKAYLAGPMTGYPNLNLSVAEDAARRLRAQGHEIVSPWEEEDVVEGDARVVDDSEYETYLARDFELIESVEAVILLPGWGMSGGAGREIRKANELGLSVYLYQASQTVGAQLIGPVKPWLTEHFSTTKRAPT